MPYVRNKGVNIYYEVEDGPEPAMVFVHGWTANMNFWKEQRSYFRGKNKMIFVDNRGHGQSEKPLEKELYSLDHFVSDLDAVVSDVGLDKFILVGHSLGSMISMKYTHNFPEKVIALILIGGGVRIRSFHRYGYPLALLLGKIAYTLSSKYVAQISFGRSAARELREWGWKQAMEHSPSYAVINIYRTLAKINLRDVASKIKAPTLILVGEEDKALPVSKSMELNKLIANSKLVVVQKAGHCVMLEQPEDVNKAIDEFILKITDEFHISGKVLNK